MADRSTQLSIVVMEEETLIEFATMPQKVAGLSVQSPTVVITQQKFVQMPPKGGT